MNEGESEKRCPVGCIGSLRGSGRVMKVPEEWCQSYFRSKFDLMFPDSMNRESEVGLRIVRRQRESR